MKKKQTLELFKPSKAQNYLHKKGGIRISVVCFSLNSSLMECTNFNIFPRCKWRSQPYKDIQNEFHQILSSGLDLICSGRGKEGLRKLLWRETACNLHLMRPFSLCVTLGKPIFISLSRFSYL